MSKSEMTICPKCGWYDGLTHARECSKKKGEAADRLMQAVNTIESTKLGYGFGNIAFVFDKDHTLTLQVHDNGTFNVLHLHWLGDLSQGGAKALIVTLNLLARKAGG